MKEVTGLLLLAAVAIGGGVAIGRIGQALHKSGTQVSLEDPTGKAIALPETDSQGQLIPRGRPVLLVVSSGCPSCSAHVLDPEKVINKSSMPVIWVATEPDVDRPSGRRLRKFWFVRDNDKKLLPEAAYRYAPQALSVDGAGVIKRQIVGASVIKSELNGANS